MQLADALLRVIEDTKKFSWKAIDGKPDYFGRQSYYSIECRDGQWIAYRDAKAIEWDNETGIKKYADLIDVIKACFEHENPNAFLPDLPDADYLKVSLLREVKP